MGFFDGVYNAIANKLADRLIGASGKTIATARDYREGFHRRQLKVKDNQFDDNIVLNFAGLIANRVTSQVIGGGVTLDFEGDDEIEDEREAWVKACLNANHQEILFHRAELAATEAGTGYLDLSGGSVFGKDGKAYPRITLLDPAFVTIETMPEDFEIVLRYVIQYKITGPDGKERARRRTIEHLDGGSWEIIDYHSDSGDGARWIEDSRTPWAYDFAPVVHWQNLPSVDSVYGEPDIDANLIRLQDRVNFVASNLSKIIRIYAHPKMYSVNADFEKLDVGVDQIIKLVGQDADLRQLEQLGDLSGSMEYLRTLRQTMFDNARVVDIDSMQDKLGALTNFGLKVLYQDNLNLVKTKRELFGDAIEDLVIRLQTIADKKPLPAVCVWPDFLPVNETEISTAYQADLNMQIVSRQTIADKRGYDWTQEQERMDAEKASGDNVGAAILRAFENGGGQNVRSD